MTQNTLADYVELTALIQKEVSLRLLRANRLPLIISFLYRQYKMGDLRLSVPYHMMQQLLADYLTDTGYQDTEEQEQQIMTVEEKAKKYLDEWIEARYPRNVVGDEKKEPMVFLSHQVEKVYQVFETIRKRNFVGTESKFQDILRKLWETSQTAISLLAVNLVRLLARQIAPVW